MSEPIIFDTRALARDACVLQGTVRLSELSRVVATVRNPDESLSYKAVGFVAENGRDGVRLSVAGTLVLQCQRCLEPLAFSLDVVSVFEFIRDESDLSQDDMEDESKDFLLASKTFDLASLLEDEVILAIPFAPRHDQCDLPKPKGVDDAQFEQSPFSVLKGLKGRVQ